jgi:hypothetical protein
VIISFLAFGYSLFAPPNVKIKQNFFFQLDYFYLCNSAFKIAFAGAITTLARAVLCFFLFW